MKKLRQQAIVDIVSTTVVGSQADIVRELANRGIDANQATVSRDIQQLGLIRVGHRYTAPPTSLSTRPESVDNILRNHVIKVDCNASLIVLKTPPGHAHIVAVALDGLEGDDIVGTVAGDDTLLVVPRDKRVKKALMEQFSALIETVHA